MPAPTTELITSAPRSHVRRSRRSDRRGMARFSPKRCLRYHLDVSTLVPSGEPRDRGTEELAARVAELEARLGRRNSDIGRMKSELAAFKIKYKEQVGRLHDELDELELGIAEAELGERSRRLADGEAASPSPNDAQREPSPRYTTDAVRRHFRDVARTIHQNLAEGKI